MTLAGGTLGPDQLRSEGSGLEFRTRSGNSLRPDKTWSDWSGGWDARFCAESECQIHSVEGRAPGSVNSGRCDTGVHSTNMPPVREEHQRIHRGRAGGVLFQFFQPVPIPDSHVCQVM